MLIYFVGSNEMLQLLAIRGFLNLKRSRRWLLKKKPLNISNDSTLQQITTHVINKLTPFRPSTPREWAWTQAFSIHRAQISPIAASKAKSSNRTPTLSTQVNTQWQRHHQLTSACMMREPLLKEGITIRIHLSCKCKQEGEKLKVTSSVKVSSQI